MRRVFEPRYPTNNAGFVFVTISIFLSLTTICFFAIVIANQHRRGEPGDGTFNWPFSLIIIAVGLVLFGLAIFGLRRLLKNEPRRVKLEDDQITIERVPRRGQPGTPEIEIPLRQLVTVDQEDSVLAGETAKGGIRFKGLMLEWQAEPGGTDKRVFRLSERDVIEFDLLMDEVFAMIPEPARGQRTFDR